MNDPAARARAAIERAVAALLEPEAGVRLGLDPEDVHRMRVASRRLRAALATFGSLLPGKALEKRERELKSVTRALAAVRDLDVQRDLLLETMEASRSVAVRAALAYTCDRLAARRIHEHQGLVRVLDEQPLRDLAERVRVLAAHARDDRGGERTLGEIAAGILASRVARAFAGIDLSMRREAPEQLHARRIELKKLRYSIEALGDALPEPMSGALYGLCKRMQEVLGQHHDAIVLAEIVVAERANLVPGADPRLRAGLTAAARRFRMRARRAFAEYRAMARGCGMRKALRRVPV